MDLYNDPHFILYLSVINIKVVWIKPIFHSIAISSRLVDFDR